MGRSVLGHVNSLAVSNYLGLRYALSDVELVEFVSSKEIDESPSRNVDCSGGNQSAARKIIQKLFLYFTGIHPRLAGIFIEVMSWLNSKGEEYEIQAPITYLRRSPFIFENLVHLDQYLVRDLDKSTINVTLDLTNLPRGEQGSKNEFEHVSKFTQALKDLFISGVFPKLQIVNLDVYVGKGVCAAEKEENIQIRHNKEESSTYKLVTKVTPACDLTSMIQCFMMSDIQVLTQSPSDASLATSILHPAKLVLVDRNSPLKLRTWTQVL